MLIVGGMVSTEKVALGSAAGARFPARSLAVPAVMDIPRVPFPLIELMVTLRVMPLTVSTDTVPVAVPVLFSFTFAAIKVLALKFASE